MSNDNPHLTAALASLQRFVGMGPWVPEEQFDLIESAIVRIAKVQGYLSSVRLAPGDDASLSPRFEAAQYLHCGCSICAAHLARLHGSLVEDLPSPDAISPRESCPDSTDPSAARNIAP